MSTEKPTAGPIPKARPMGLSLQFTCATCKETKPSTHFHQRASSKTGYAPSCRACVNRKRRAAQPATAGTGTRLKALAKKGDLDGLKTALAQPSRPSLKTLLNACVTPYLSHPKTAAHAKTAHFLLAQGADANARGTQGESMLCLAAKTGRADLVKTLVQGGATVDFFAATAVLALDVVIAGLHRDPCQSKAIDPSGLTGLHFCAGSALGRQPGSQQERQLQIIAALLDAGADPNSTVDTGIETTPLVSCCQSGGTVEVIHTLVRRGADPNHPHVLRSALRHFKQKRSDANPVADALLEAGGRIDAPIDDNGRTCLHLYSHHEEIQAVSWLLRHGASAQVQTIDGRTPLHLAAERNNGTKIARLLLDHDADPYATDQVGAQPLDYASDNDKTTLVELLKSYGSAP
jgi:ankyrin repeat protein